MGSMIRSPCACHRGCRRAGCYPILNPTKGSQVDLDRSNLPHGRSAKALRKPPGVLATSAFQQPPTAKKASKIARPRRGPQDILKTVQDGFQDGEDDPIWTPRRPRWPPRWPAWPKWSRRRHSMPSKDGQDSRRWPEYDPRWHQYGHKWPQDDTKRPEEGPRGPRAVSSSFLLPLLILPLFLPQVFLIGFQNGWGNPQSTVQ